MKDFTGKLVRIVSPKGNIYPNEYCDYFSTCVQYLVKKDQSANYLGTLLDVVSDHGDITTLLIGKNTCAHLIEGDYWEVL